MSRLIVVIVACCLLLSVLGASERTLNIPIAFQNGLSGYLMVQGQDVSKVTTGITQTLDDGRDIVGVQVTSNSGKPLSVDTISLGVRVPGNEIDGIWTPSGRVSDNRLISADAGTSFVAYSAANYGIPYLAAATSMGRNVFAAGLLQQDLSVVLRVDPNQNQFYDFQLQVNVPPGQMSVSHQFFISNNPTDNWYRVAERYTDWVDAGTHYSQFPISERAYKPVYDTWYWSQDDVNDNLYFETARSAAEVGFGTFLADSGWDAATGEYSKWLMGSTGNYSPSAQQFPDLPGTFDSLRSAFNLQIQLWLQPFAVGRTSTRYPQTQALHIQIPGGSNNASLAPFALPLGSKTLEDVNLCPQLTATHQYLRNLFNEMASDYHPEGYWLDFIDGIPPMCVAPHKHDYATFGDGFRAAMATIRDTVLSNDPEAVVQFRAQYANLNNKPFANVWQPFDSPGNYDRMRLDALRLRPFSKGVLFAADELYWPETYSDIDVARFVMTDVMTGIPSIGANLKDSRPSSVDIVKNWMRFYAEYRDDLTNGRFRPIGSFQVPNHTIESNKRMFVYIRKNGSVEFSVSRRKQIFLMNATDIRRVTASVSIGTIQKYSVQAYNRHLQPEGAATETVSFAQGILDIDAVVQRGGVLVLTPIS